ncbi:MAG: AtpZ/AtpI family protein [Butyrivibrio sp.]|nr:AtpZ/AtpI family protein [Butyrivibrio sp.]
MDSGKKGIFRMFALITQLGLHVMVPTALCVALGVLIDRRFGTYWVIPLLFLGILAGGRNAYRLAMSAAKADSRKDNPKAAPSKEQSDEGNESDEG